MKTEPLKRFVQLASKAAVETGTGTDVAQRVLITLQSRPLRRKSLEPEYLGFCIGSCLAAGTALVVFWMGMSEDTLIALALPFVTVLS